MGVRVMEMKKQVATERVVPVLRDEVYAEVELG